MSIPDDSAVAGGTQIAGTPGRPARPACNVPSNPHGLRYARRYIVGWRCDKHTPAAMQGKPEPRPGPGWPIFRTEAT
ncbi:hypothetical protein AB0I77_29510 [Streptomyces sp. NPDC050619]|uniref:hypothetical protein n=1 Tax=Streptomyces sp. NPDC050619 TaxID=3157214 RepID=UPI0034408288